MSESVGKQQRDEVDKAIKNIQWARDACLDGELLKSNSHLHRAEELLKQYRNSNR